MKPVVLSVRPVAGISKKTGRDYSCVCYDVLYLNNYNRYCITSVFVGSDRDPHFIPGDIVVRNGFTNVLEKIGHSDVIMEILDTLN